MRYFLTSGRTYFEVVQLRQHLLPTVPAVIQTAPDVFQRRHHLPQFVRRHALLCYQLLTALEQRRVVHMTSYDLRLHNSQQYNSDVGDTNAKEIMVVITT